MIKNYEKDHLLINKKILIPPHSINSMSQEKCKTL